MLALKIQIASVDCSLLLVTKEERRRGKSRTKRKRKERRRRKKIKRKRRKMRKKRRRKSVGRRKRAGERRNRKVAAVGFKCEAFLKENCIIKITEFDNCYWTLLKHLKNVRLMVINHHCKANH